MKTLTLSIAAILALNTIAAAQFAQPAQWQPAPNAAARPPEIIAHVSGPGQQFLTES